MVRAPGPVPPCHRYDPSSPARPCRRSEPASPAPPEARPAQASRRSAVTVPVVVRLVPVCRRWVVIVPVVVRLVPASHRWARVGSGRTATRSAAVPCLSVGRPAPVATARPTTRRAPAVARPAPDVSHMVRARPRYGPPVTGVDRRGPTAPSHPLPHPGRR
ncbi:hypothetical protein [Micromonospora sp. WMMD975]|uniref:hypothetical protein n=1 Tax=Micromonospora sp. WMMD975 TaxID=3016087 RepID=UPI00249C0CD3|nr:hypothetical protein [Micromonospora sp. WMMD975]WFE34979.1 hypothetical protein O7613_06215 [Micromonospora sp. WMMD975]